MHSNKRKVVDINSPRKKREGPAKEEDKKKKKSKSSAFSSRRIAVALVLMGIIGAGVAVHVAFSYAAVSLWPQKKTLSFENSVRVQGGQEELNLEQKIIPAKVLESEKSATKLYPATGSLAQEARARGTVRVFNTNNRSQILVVNTRFLSEGGKLFRSLSRISIPANSFTDVEVAAAEPGEEYNIGPSNFSVPGLVGSPLYTLIYGKSFGTMSGGSKTFASVVSESDIENAKNSLVEELISAAKEDLRKRGIAPFVVEESSFHTQVLQAGSSVKPGAELSQFSASASVRVSALMFDRTHVQELVLSELSSQLTSGEVLHTNSLELSWQAKGYRSESEAMDLDLKAGIQAYRQIDTNELALLMQGKSKSEAEQVLRADPFLASFDVSLWPFWLQGVPQDIGKIRFEVVLD